MRVLVTVSFNDNQLRAHLLPILSLDGVEVRLVSDGRPSPVTGLTVTVPPRWLVRLVGRALAKLLVCVVIAVRERPDWVIGFNLVPHGLNAIGIARLARTRSIYEMIGGEREWRGGGWSSDNKVLGRLRRPQPLLERLLLRRIRRSTFVVVMGQRGRQALLERGVPPERVVVVPPAIDVERFRPDDRRRAEYDVVTVAALLPNKRVDDVLQAVALLRRAHPAARAAVAGEGPLEGELRAHARELGLEDAVDFLGFRDDVDELYRTSRTFVLASAFEGLSVAMMEAMAAGVVPVVTDVGELGELVRDGETGRLFRVGDVEALAGILAELLGDDDRRRAMADAGRAAVVARASVPAVTAIYAEVLR